MALKTLLCVLLLGPLFTRSQTLPQERSVPEQSNIEVVGTAVKEVSPDRIMLSIVLSEKDNNGKQYTIDQQDLSLRKILSSMQVPLSKLLLSDASSALVSYKAKGQQARRTKEYNLELQTADQVSSLLQSLSEAEIKEATITKVDHSKIDSLKREVRVAAIRAAKEKAIYLAQAIGTGIGPALQIREVDQYPESLAEMIGSNTLLRGVDEESSNLNFRRLKISSSIFVRFALPQ